MKYVFIILCKTKIEFKVMDDLQRIFYSGEQFEVKI